VPVNAASDLSTVRGLLSDLGAWLETGGGEAVVVVNNYPEADGEPAGVAALRSLPITLLAIPELPVRHGEVRPVAARAAGAEHASSDLLVHFDADVRLTDAVALLDWYVQQFAAGARVAATDVGFHSVPSGLSIRARIVSHGLARWAKRVLLRTPVTRGSNYATDRSLFLEAYRRGMIADELNVGPALVALGARYVYSGDRRLRVLTSARRFRPGWARLFKYLAYRLAYNVRSLPVDERAADRTKRWNDPSDRWDQPS
jgi:hypothetical protein